MGRQWRVELESTILGVGCRQLNKQVVSACDWDACVKTIVGTFYTRRRQQKRHLHLIRIIRGARCRAPRWSSPSSSSTTSGWTPSAARPSPPSTPPPRRRSARCTLHLQHLLISIYYLLYLPLGGGGGQGGRGHCCEGRQVAWRQGHVTKMQTSHWTGRPSSWALSGGPWMLQGGVRWGC